MIYDSLFFSEGVKNKLAIYKTLSSLEPDIYRVQEIIHHDKFSYHQTIRILKEISEDLLKLDFPQGDFISPGGKIKISKQLPNIIFYRSSLLSHSIAFQYILSIVNNGQEDSLSFCKRFGISKSNLVRKIQPLSEFVKAFEMKFTYNPINITGDEYNVRLFLTRVVWIGLRGLSNPFTKIPTRVPIVAENFAILNSNYQKENQQEIIWGATIHSLRYDQGYIFETTDKFKEFSDNIVNIKMLDDSLAKYFKTKEDWEKEKTGMLFYSILKHTRGERRQTFNKVFDIQIISNNHPIKKLSNNLFTFLEKSQLLPNEIETRNEILDEITYEAFLIYCIPKMILFPDNFVYRLPKESKNIEIVEDLLNIFYERHKSLLSLHFNGSQRNLFLTRYLKLYLTSIWPAYQRNIPFTVGISMENSNHHRSCLMQELQTLRHVVIENFSVKRQEKYDLVIYSSSNFPEKYPDIKGHFWSLSSGEDDLVELLTKILRLSSIKKKNYICKT
ncbi:MAG: helix-turn-helix domain-containing protein [Streptococcaceae bacterium]|jgi:hypothetical protein|nr:helix-turn-helix domain-containing protein [Streptococcaceae bacterium]